MRSKIIKRVESVILSGFMLVAPLATLEGWAREHWSLQPMKRVAVPAKGNPIDYFIGRKLREQGL